MVVFSATTGAIVLFLLAMGSILSKDVLARLGLWIGGLEAVLRKNACVHCLMRWHQVVFLVLISVSFSTLTLLNTANAYQISDLRFGEQSSGGTRVVLEVDKEIPLKGFSLERPARFVLDLSPPSGASQDSSGIGAVLEELQQSKVKGVIKDVRAGLFRQGILRIVFDLSDPVWLGNTIVLKGEKTQRYVFDLYAVGEKPSSIKDTQQSLDSFESDQWSDYISGLDQQKNSTQITLASRDPSLPSQRPSSGYYSSSRVPVIVIDPGHGGVDPGAVNTRLKLKEKDITLAMAKLLQKRFNKKGYRTVLTRSNDVYVKLSERYRIAENNGANVFVSLHADAHRNSRIQGMSIYVLSDVASDKEALRLARQENNSDILAGIGVASIDDQLITNILIDIQQRETRKESLQLAKDVVSSVRGTTRLIPNTIRFAGFVVLKSAFVPSILVEMGYLSNPQEARLLTQKSYRNRFADSVSKALEQYLNTRSQLLKS